MKKNIIHLAYSGLGGTSSVIFQIIQNKEKNIYNFWNDKIVFSGDYIKNSFKKFCILKNVEFKFNKTIKYLSIFFWPRVFFYLVKFKPDIVFVHNFEIIPAYFYSIIFKKKIIYVDHVPLNLKLGIKLNLASMISFKLSDITIVLNSDNKKYFDKIEKKKCYLIANGIKIIKKNFNKKKKKHIKLGMAARMNHTKNHEMLIKLMASKTLDKHNLKLYLAGSGENLKKLKRLTQVLNIEHKVNFLGILDGKKLWLELIL